MVLIRLCHVADLPTPGELVRSSRRRGSARSAAPPRPPQAGRGGTRAWRRRRRDAAARQVAARPRARTSPRAAGAAPGELSRRRGPGRRRGASRRCTAHLRAFGASGALRAAGDRVAARSRRRPAIWPRGLAAAAAGSDRHALDDRAVERAGRADLGRAGRRRRRARGARPPPIIRWCRRSWRRFPARRSRRSHDRPRRRLWLAASRIAIAGYAGLRAAGRRTSRRRKPPWEIDA